MSAAAAMRRFAPAAGRESPLPGMAAADWRALIRALDVQPIGAVSDHGLGSYEMRPARLAELGLMENVRRAGTRAIGDFKPPLAEQTWLQRPGLQLEAVSQSLIAYDAELREGALAWPPGLGRAAALAALQAGGRGALAAWRDRGARARKGRAWPAAAWKRIQAAIDRCKGLP